MSRQFILLAICAGSFIIGHTQACSFRSAGWEAAGNFSQGLIESSANVGNAIKESANQLDQGMKESTANLQMAAIESAKELRKGMEESSAKLEKAVKIGADAAKEVVREMSQGLVALADSVDVRMDSGDLAHIGKDAAEQLKLALVELSKNWHLAVNTADLKDVGASAADHLSQALQNINIRISLLILGREHRELPCSFQHRWEWRSVFCSLRLLSVLRRGCLVVRI